MLSSLGLGLCRDRRRQRSRPTRIALWEDIDLNCGEIVDGNATVEEIGRRLFDLMLATASGSKTKSELHGYGQSEFVPWYLGAVM